MRAVIQRVTQASVEVDGNTTGQIGQGLLILLGVEREDTLKDADYIIQKISTLRIFEDAYGKMNLSLSDVSGEILIVSQFTLCGDARHGRRPSFSNAAPPDAAISLYEYVASNLAVDFHVERGVFSAFMNVQLVNSGPVTILLDSKKLF